MLPHSGTVVKRDLGIGAAEFVPWALALALLLLLLATRSPYG
jgi:hypothetical protein